MKKFGSVLIIPVLTAALIWGTVSLASAQAQSQPAQKEPVAITIARAVVGTGVENGEPTGVAETFPASTEKVYCFVEATQIPKDTEVTFVWSYGDKESSKFSLPAKTGSRWRTWAYKNLGGRKGDWKVEIKDADGKVLKEIKFKVG